MTDFLLVAVSGNRRGACWPIPSEGLVVGRDSEADIVLRDPVVSRQHCRVTKAPDGIVFEDLGSRNPALVNGKACGQTLLNPGDAVAVGQSQFLLVTHRGGTQRSSSGGSSLDTWSWSKADPFAIPAAGVKPATQVRPRTVRDLTALYEITRAFSACETMAQLAAAAEQELVQRFKPENLWIALVRGEGDLFFLLTEHTNPDGPAAFPEETIRQARQRGEGLLAPVSIKRDGRKAMRCAMAAPALHGGAQAALIALETGPPAGFYDEEDLRLLVLIAQVFGPHVRAVESLEQLRRDNVRLRARAGESTEIVGASKAACAVRDGAAKAARSDLSVLILGETGTGKELVARSVHEQSNRRDHPFVTVNCAAIPHALFEGHLFGYEKGAFTSAETSSPGLWAQAHGGTLFLDEIGDLSLDNQARILRAIEDGTFYRVGATEQTRVDARIITATNADLRAAIEKGLFRQDLYHRLNGFEVRVPPLRDRRSDIPLLAKHFLEMEKPQAKRPVAGFSAEAIDYLKRQGWPGNVRELRNCVRRAVSIATSGQIGLDDVASPSLEAALGGTEQGYVPLADVEKRHIARVLRECEGNIKQTAEILGVARSTLYNKIKQYGL